MLSFPRFHRAPLPEAAVAGVDDSPPECDDQGDTAHRPICQRRIRQHIFERSRTCLQDERHPLNEAAAADIADLIAAVQGPGERAPSAAECSHMSARLLADQYEVLPVGCR